MRPFCIATISAILGIIMGLYLKSIAFFVILFITFLIVIFVLYKNIYSIHKYIKVSIIFIICFSIFYLYTFLLEQNYQKIDTTYDNQEIQIRAIVVSGKTEKEYKDVYEIKVEAINNNIQNHTFNMILNIKRNKNSHLELEYGDEITFKSIYETPSSQRNEGGFDYKQYLKTQKITGTTTVKPNDIIVLNKNKTFITNRIIYNIRSNSINKIKQFLPENSANLCTALLLGEKKELSEDINEAFRKSSLSHMLAISGAHVSYILLGITTFIKKLKIHKKLGKVILIIFLLFFICLVNFTPSVTRACIMAILQLSASILFRKSDIYQNLAISSFIILAFNPYALLDIGFQLSFGGTIGIIIFSKRLQNKKGKLKETTKEEKLNIIKLAQKIIGNIKEMCIVTISANLLIVPIMMYHFNTISFTFIISNLLAAPILGVSIILSMIFLILLFIFKPLAIILSILLNPILQILILIAQFSSKLPFSQVLVPTPKIWQIIIYYIILAILFYKKKGIQNINQIVENTNKINKSKISINKNKVIIFLIFLIILPYIISIFPSNKLIINFIDVGQGDSTLIQTPYNKTVLIDGGGSETGSFDVGEKTLIPYLLDKGIMKIDYIIFSHFDADHCEGLLSVMEALKVNKAIIGKQEKLSENYNSFINIAKKKKVEIITVQAGDKIQIDKSCSITILFPEEDLISTNSSNNNSVVAKFAYKLNNSQEFSMLLTGDIEEVAEKRLIEKYKIKNENILNSTILKVAHHRFKNFINKRIS